MYNLASGDVLKINQVSSISVGDALTFLAYELDVRVSENIKM